jgi:tripartite ATP-independent transporter DctQ subunit
MAEAQAQGKSWGAPLGRLDSAWQSVEGRLCSAVLLTEVVSLALWVTLKGLASDFVPGGNASGVVCRQVLGATILGIAVHRATRGKEKRVHGIAVGVAIFVGTLTGRFLAHTGVHWSGNLLNWLQNASVLMLIGGLRGFATRLTLWVALLGASLAASRGKHIHVDVLLRYIPTTLRMPAAIAGWVAAALVCASGAIGFVDYISIASFRAPAMKACPDDASKQCDTTAGEKLGHVAEELSGDFFLLRRQITLDFRSTPRVIVGTPYDQWMSASDWNEWLDDGDWSAHYDKSAVDALRADPAVSPTHTPAVVVPGTGEDARGILIRELNFVFPFGLMVIALKFLLRVLLALSGRINVDPNAAHAEEGLSHAKDEVAA